MVQHNRSQVNGMAKAKLFGYVCVEVDGHERILVASDDDGQWDFSIIKQMSASDDVDSALNAVVGALIEGGVISLASLLDMKLEKCSTIRIPNAPAYFAKVRVSEEASGVGSFRWVGKEIFANGMCRSQELLNLILYDYVIQLYGLVVLECVDAVVYRREASGIEFLMLRRRDPNAIGYKSEYPKGGLKYHETIVEGALRELREETGVSSYTVRHHLGLRAVDVRERKREYDLIRVHGLACEYSGGREDIRPAIVEGFEAEYDWVSLEEAVKRIWIRTYGVEFLKRTHYLVSGTGQ